MVVKEAYHAVSGGRCYEQTKRLALVDVGSSIYSEVNNDSRVHFKGGEKDGFDVVRHCRNTLYGACAE